MQRPARSGSGNQPGFRQRLSAFILFVALSRRSQTGRMALQPLLAVFSAVLALGAGGSDGLGRPCRGQGSQWMQLEGWASWEGHATAMGGCWSLGLAGLGPSESAPVAPLLRRAAVGQTES